MKHSASLRALALPIHTRVLHDARGEVIHNRAQPLLATKAIEKREFLFYLSGFCGPLRRGAVNRLGGFYAFFAGAFTSAGQLLLLGHPLRGALIGVAAA